jgi:peptidoglycan/LPS O-acetylase OafA/YrhL
LPKISLIGLSLIVAVLSLSYEFVEKPILRLKDRRSGVHRPPIESANSPEAVRAA